MYARKKGTLNRHFPRIADKARGPKLSYGSILVITTFLLMAIAFGSTNSFGVFFKPMLNEFGWTREATSGPYSLSMIVGGLFGIVAGRLSDRFNPAKVVTVAGIFLGSGYLLMSRINGLWQLYLFYGILVAIGSGGIFIPLVYMITRQFVERRGLITGIAVSGIGFGVAIVPPIASQLIANYDWRTSMLIVGAVALVLIVALAQLIRNQPENTRQHNNAVNTKVNAVASNNEFSLKGATRTRPFWLLCIAWFFYGFCYQVGMVHIVPHATDLGMPQVAAASILIVIGILGAVGRGTFGLAADRFGNKVATTAGFVLLSAAFLVLLASGVWILYLFAVIYGFSFGFGILLSPIAAEFFGLRALGTIMGVIAMSNSIGGAIGPIVAGHIFDTSSTYFVAFLLCGIFSIIGGIIISLLKPAS